MLYIYILPTPFRSHFSFAVSHKIGSLLDDDYGYDLNPSASKDFFLDESRQIPLLVLLTFHAY